MDITQPRAPMDVSSRAWGAGAVVLGLGVVYATSVPGWHFGWLMLVGFGWMWFALGWLIVLGLLLVRPGRLVALRRHWAFWAVPPLVVGLVGAPVRVRFELSRGSLDHFAASMSEGTPLGKRRWVGLYPVAYVDGSRRSFGFMIEDTGMFGDYGFAWSPKGEPDIDGPGHYRHYDGPWYLWIDD
ncbi:hypothetical protein ACIBEJ_39905 [Nonomuraea sp. NPDC050790]|uniref:hypothetical protein n=1 Tax=Nonomuraea sp. NPDC050790 TaxID=3364371 RepID=UPI0037AC3E9C